jgi:hypothetical protein
MILLNFSHPFPPEQLTQFEKLAGEPVTRKVDWLVQFDLAAPIAPQVVTLVDSLGLSPDEWQTLPIVVNPPAHNLIAVTVLAELHGRMGYFPTVVRLRPLEGAVQRTEVAELINLQCVRNEARSRRHSRPGSGSAQPGNRT